jgi:hypothetical protein
MFRSFARTADADPPEPAVAGDAAAVDGVEPAAIAVAAQTPAAATALGPLVVAWVVVLFARQVGEASAATARAEDLRRANAVMAAEVEALERELDLIGRQAYIVQQARAHRLGGNREIAFTLEAGAPPLGFEAPGSASVRLGAQPEVRRSPLESWLELLFGPSG